MKLKLMRIKKRLTQGQLGIRIGVTQQCISKIENGNTGRVTLEKVQEFAKTFNMCELDFTAMLLNHECPHMCSLWRKEGGNMKNKSAIYIRVSTHYQIDKDSLPLQRKDMINYSKFALNIEDYEIFEDAGLSAKNTDRPAFQDMMKRIRNNEFTHVLVWKIDRISRNLLDFCDMYNEFKKYNVCFVSKNEQFDTSSAMGEAMLKIILVFAELERKLTGERVKATMLSRANEGKWNGAPVPLGYKWDKVAKFPIIDEIEAKTIKLIYSEYLSKKSTTAIRELLNYNNIRTKRGGSWTTKTISDIIRNPFYKGTYRYNYRESSRGKVKDEKEWIVVEDNHSPIVSKELWEQCNKIMNINSQHNNNANFRKSGIVHVFASLIKCGECGGTLYSKQDKPNLDGFRPTIYVCSGRYNNLGCNQKTISDKIVGTFVLTYVSNILRLSKSLKKLSKEDFEKELIKGLKNVIGIEDVEIIYNACNGLGDLVFNKKNNETEIEDYEMENIKKEIAKYKRALERLEDLYLFSDAGMSEKNYIIKKTKINDKLEELNNKIKSSAEIEENLNLDFFMDFGILALDHVFKSKKIDFKEVINNVGKEILRDFMNSIIDNIIVKDKRITSVTFKNGLTNKFVYAS
ncbi:recombinase family protein [Clostridium frigidicarnis]|uniref:Site-specific DNA recombinase n=1 Tax=Clostridium frigidicarnis TaxID=84698 RepID=A0A1I0V5M1_9CLOT|nr:recombinase family protein [Clostridium frigidicarnis]SFA70846.1 Site-specific DNA recombinase [Clostridium frigidicarnis]